jgi:NAD+ synthase (glutamine-hydrolysing)
MKRFLLALGQINATVGDLEGNTRKVVGAIEQARAAGANLVALPEMALPGYPSEDLLLMPTFVDDNLLALQEVAAATRGITALVGFVDRDVSDIYNAAALLHDGELVGVYHKHYLPNYGVFDEERYFRPGRGVLLFTLDGATVGVNVCEDIWYPAGPTEAEALAGAQLIVNLSASPYSAAKGASRGRMLATRAADNVVVVAQCNLVGGQDELVFDGDSSVWSERGQLLARARQFEEDLLFVDLDLQGVFRQRLHDPRQRREEREGGEPVQRVELPALAALPRAEKVELGRIEPSLESEAEIYRALLLGTRDYVTKNGFRQVLIGLSGGIDSSLVAAIAVDALGADNVHGVYMPTRYSSTMSEEDARQLADKLGIHFMVVPIDDTFQAYLDMLAKTFEGTTPGLAEENIQARIRGNALMALSNKYGWMVLTTGNKSELAVGYATLYGDMAGGFAVIKDVLKRDVYRLSRYRNSLQQVIPERVLTRAPSAELRPDQTDEQSLGPYATLDPIVQAYVEEDRSLEEIVVMGYDEATVRRILRMIDQAEYKRRQGAPGVKITARAFGKDRRLPITNRYRQ